MDLTNEIKEFSLLVNLSGGVGLSAVNSADKIAEELIYMTIVNLELDYLFNRLVRIFIKIILTSVMTSN